MILNVKYSQKGSGISGPILQHPGISISYLTPTWITSVRQLLFQHNLSISLTDTKTIKLRVPKDRCIMNSDTLSLDCMYLQIITLSDMSPQDQNLACTNHLQGTRRPNQKLGQKKWPKQGLPSALQLRLLRKCISSFLRYSNKWKQALGPSIPKVRSLTDIIIHHPTIHQHIKNSHLLHDH